MGELVKSLVEYGNDYNFDTGVHLVKDYIMHSSKDANFPVLQLFMAKKFLPRKTN